MLDKTKIKKGIQHRSNALFDHVLQQLPNYFKISTILTKVPSVIPLIQEL